VTRHIFVLTIATLAGLGSASVAAQPRTSVAPGARTGVRVSGAATIQGNTLTSTNGTLGDAVVRLRDARTGRIAGTTTSDKAGLFMFRVSEPGSYVVELLGHDEAVLAASQILNINTGDSVSAIVKLPFRLSAFDRILGHSLPSAAIVTSTAAAAGVLARQVSGDQVSPRR
jgi:hypothetical protein